MGEMLRFAYTTADGGTSPTRAVECNVGNTAGPALRDVEEFDGDDDKSLVEY